MCTACRAPDNCHNFATKSPADNPLRLLEYAAQSSGGYTMADIFKRRKVPTHLIIKDSYEYHRKPRSGLLRWVLWFVGLLLLTGLALELRYLNGV